MKRKRKNGFLENATVAEAMTSRVVTFGEDTPCTLAMEIAIQVGHVVYPVLDGNGLIAGIVYYEDLVKNARASRSQDDSPKIKDIARRKYLVIAPDDSLKSAMEMMITNEVGRLLVVEPDDPALLVGIISRGDILKYYEERVSQEGGMRG